MDMQTGMTTNKTLCLTKLLRHLRLSHRKISICMKELIKAVRSYLIILNTLSVGWVWKLCFTVKAYYFSWSLTHTIFQTTLGWNISIKFYKKFVNSFRLGVYLTALIKVITFKFSSNFSAQNWPIQWLNCSITLLQHVMRASFRNVFIHFISKFPKSKINTKLIILNLL
jgi:hypothetical protein